MSYSGDPSASDLDRVRFLVGDTDTSDELLLDAEIAHLLLEHGVAYAPAEGATAIAAKLSRKVDYATGSARYSLSQRVTHYRALALELRTRADRQAVPVSTGQSRDTDRTDRVDSDLKQPSFERDQFRNPKAPARPGGGTERSRYDWEI